MRLYSPPTEDLNFGAIKIGSCSYARFLPHALSGAVDIVREIVLLPHAPSYSAGCSIYWSINLHLLRAKLVTFLDTAPITVTIGDALIGRGVVRSDAGAFLTSYLHHQT
jgi:hypothetical protein